MLLRLLSGSLLSCSTTDSAIAFGRARKRTTCCCSSAAGSHTEINWYLIQFSLRTLRFFHLSVVNRPVSARSFPKPSLLDTCAASATETNLDLKASSLGSLPKSSCEAKGKSNAAAHLQFIARSDVWELLLRLAAVVHERV